MCFCIRRVVGVELRLLHDMVLLPFGAASHPRGMRVAGVRGFTPDRLASSTAGQLE